MESNRVIYRHQPNLQDIWLQSLSMSFMTVILFTNPSGRAGYDTRSIFKRSLTGLNSEFSFSYTSCLTKAEEPSLSYYLAIAGGRIIGFIPFPRVLVLCEMQSVSSRIWTRVAVSISYDDNNYTTGTTITGLNSESSFSYTSCLTKAEEPSLLYYLPIAGGRIIGFIPFPRVLVLCEMQSVSSRIWTRVAVFISYDDNNYTTGTTITGLNSESSFSYTSCLTKAEEPSLLYYLPIAGGRIIGFIPFPRVLVLCEMQSVSSRIWTRVAVSISYDDNNYTTGTTITGLNSEFSFSYTSCLTKAEELSLPYYLPIAGGRIIGFIPFPRVLVLCEMPSV